MRVGTLVTWRECLPSYKHAGWLRSQRSHGHARTDPFIHSSSTHLPIHRYIHSTIHRFLHPYDSLRPSNLLMSNPLIHSMSLSFAHYFICSTACRHMMCGYLVGHFYLLMCPLLLCLVTCISVCHKFGFYNLHLPLIGVLMFYARIKCEWFLIAMSFFRTVLFERQHLSVVKGVAT